MKTAPSHLRSHVQNAKTGYTSLVYQAKIVMGVSSDHAYGDKHGPISSWLKRIFFKYIFKKSSFIATAASSVVLRGLPKKNHPKWVIRSENKPNLQKKVLILHPSECVCFFQTIHLDLDSE